jgi:hypothetical protein
VEKAMNRTDWIILAVIGCLIFLIGIFAGVLFQMRQPRVLPGGGMAMAPLSVGATTSAPAGVAGVAVHTVETGPATAVAETPVAAMTQADVATTNGVVAASEPAVAPKMLAYHWQAGERLVYVVSIEATMPDGVQRREGNCFYEVKSVAGETGCATITSFSSLKRDASVRVTGALQPLFVTWRTPRTLVIDPTGHVIQQDGENQLMLGLGDVAEQLFQPLPEGTATIHRDVRVTDQTRRMNGLMPFPSPMRRMMGQQTDRSMNYSAHETVVYTVAAPMGDLLPMDVNVLLMTDERSDEGALFRQTGAGGIVFDRHVGAIKSLDIAYEVRSSFDHGTTRVPVTLHAQLLDADATEKAYAERKAATASAKRAAVEAATPKPIDNDEVTGLVGVLRGTQDRWKLMAACDRLATSIPITVRKEQVGKALDPLLKNPDEFVSGGAAKALAVWGTRADVSALAGVVDSENPFLRSDAMKALGKIPDPAGAVILVKHLPDFFRRGDASNALQSMGPIAEDAVLTMMNDKDGGVVSECVKILGVIGTGKSLPALKALRAIDRGAAGPAGDAIDAIQSRLDAQRGTKVNLNG